MSLPFSHRTSNPIEQDMSKLNIKKETSKYNNQLNQMLNYSNIKKNSQSLSFKIPQHSASEKYLTQPLKFKIDASLSSQNNIFKNSSISTSSQMSYLHHKRFHSNQRNFKKQLFPPQNSSEICNSNILTHEKSVIFASNLTNDQTSHSYPIIPQNSNSLYHSSSVIQNLNQIAHQSSQNFSTSNYGDNISLSSLNLIQQNQMQRISSPHKQNPQNSLFNQQSSLTLGNTVTKLNSNTNLIEFSKKIISEFLNAISWDKIEFDTIKNAVKELQEYVLKLESECRVLKKENIKQSKMLEILQVSHQLKDNFFQQMAEQSISIKGELKNLKQQKSQLQQIQILKDMKTPIQTTNTSQKTKVNDVVTKNQNGKWSQMKQVLENKNILSPSQFQFEALPNLQINKRQIHISNVQHSGQTSPLTQTGSPLPSSGNKFTRSLRTGKATLISGIIDSERKNLRPLFIQHSTDNAFYSSVLDLSVKDSDVIEYFQEGKYMKFVKGHFSDEQNLQKFIFNLEGQTFKYFYDSVNQLLSNLNSSMELILKAKNIIHSIYKLQRKMNISEAFDSLSNQCTQILKCDKAQVFLLDEKSNLFWTKGFRTNEMLKISLDESGFCYHVAKQGQLINVLDAHLDDRFNKKIDEKNNYKTKSVLCAPICDSRSDNQRIIGILQVINKNDSTFFTKDDEAIIKAIAILSESILKNSVFNDERAEFYNSLRFLYSYSIDAIQAQSVQQLTEMSYSFLQNSLNISQSRIILYETKNKQFYTYSQGQKSYFSTTQGVVGRVFTSQSLSVNSNISEDTDFNNMIDIDTQLPVVTLPIFQSCSFYTQKNMPSPFVIEDFQRHESGCVGVLQVINSRGITSLIIQSENEQKVLLTNYETLQRFNLLYAATFQRLSM